MKFVSHSISFVLFLVIIIISTAQASQNISKFRTLQTTYSVAYARFRTVENATDWLGNDFPLRQEIPTVIHLMLALYVLGRYAMKMIHVCCFFRFYSKNLFDTIICFVVVCFCVLFLWVFLLVYICFLLFLIYFFKYYHTNLHTM